MSGVGRRGSVGASMETNCGPLLRELEIIWTDIGETELDKDRMVIELENECLQVYRRKVNEASNTRARLHRDVAAKEAEQAALRATLGENTARSQMNKELALKEQLDLLTPSLEELRLEKQEREKLFTEILTQIEKTNREITGCYHSNKSAVEEETDLSLRKLNLYQAQLRTLQKEKSNRVRKVLEDVNEVHCLCGVLGMDFGKTLKKVHPDLQKTSSTGEATSISNKTLDELAQVIQNLKNEKMARAQKLRGTLTSIYDLRNLLDSNVEERRRFERVKFITDSSDDDIKDCGILSLETLAEATAELERLTKLKVSRMKELVLNKRIELEEVCRWAHIEADGNMAPDKISAVMDSGMVDPSQLLDNIETHIKKAKEEAMSRKDIMDRVGKWLDACEEEKWLEDYNQDDNRYSGGRGAHLNLRRAEKARIIVAKIPGIVDNLIKRTIAWENERDRPFMYDGVQLVSILEDYKITRKKKEEENRRSRDQRRLQDMLLAERESRHGSKPSPKRCNSLGTGLNGIVGSGNRIGTPRRPSAGGATPDLSTPRSYSGRQNTYFRETRTRRLSTTPLNFVALSKDDTTTSSFASISGGSEPGSPSITTTTLTDGTSQLAQ